MRARTKTRPGAAAHRTVASAAATKIDCSPDPDAKDNNNNNDTYLAQTTATCNECNIRVLAKKETAN